MRLLVDMNLSPRWVPMLEAAGLEAQHWSTVGAYDAPDRVLMTYAADHDCIV
jgi:predicted nuclease of predicted toxin-antitoxin system